MFYFIGGNAWGTENTCSICIIQCSIPLISRILAIFGVMYCGYHLYLLQVYWDSILQVILPILAAIRAGTAGTGSTLEYYTVLWYALGRPVITSEIGNWSVFVLLGWRFVFGIIIKRDGREPSIVRCNHDSGNKKAVSLLRLLRSKVSNHHGLAK